MLRIWIGAAVLIALVAAPALAQNLAQNQTRVAGLADPAPWLAFFAAHPTVPVETAPTGAGAPEPFAAAVKPLALHIEEVSVRDGKLSGAFVSPALGADGRRGFHGLMTEKGLLLRGAECALSAFPLAPGELEGFFVCGSNAPLHARIRAGATGPDAEPGP